MAADFVLYWEYWSGAVAPQILLEELQAPYDSVHVDMNAGAHQGGDYLAKNPTGQVPALTLPDGQTIGESSAMILAVGEAMPNPLTPAPGEAERAPFLYWLAYMASSMYMTFKLSNHPYRYVAGEAAQGDLKEKALARNLGHFEVLEGAIAGEPWMLRRGFTGLDAYIAMLTLWYHDKAALYAACPKIGRLCHAAAGRPAVAKVFGLHEASLLP